MTDFARMVQLHPYPRPGPSVYLYIFDIEDEPGAVGYELQLDGDAIFVGACDTDPDWPADSDLVLFDVMDILVDEAAEDDADPRWVEYAQGTLEQLVFHFGSSLSALT
jgi:hypothetical protein